MSRVPSRALVLLLAVSCGLAVANIYYAQPLLDVLAREFDVSEGRASLVVTLTQVGYAAGLVLLVPLGDLLENRRLVTTVLGATAASLLLAAVAPTLSVFLVAALAIGATSVVAQVLVPYAAALAPDAVRGAVVGRVMSGLLLGILLARTLSSLVAAALGWRAVYVGSALLMVLLALVLTRALPARRPEAPVPYGALLRSLAALVREEPVLRSRAAYQALMFGAFSVFWTSIAYELTSEHGLGTGAIGVFALVGAAGALAAPLAGRLGDAGHVRAGTGAGLALAVVGGLVALLGHGSLVLLGVAAVLLDVGVQLTMVLGQREVYSSRPEARARMNTVYIASFFAAGAAASAASGALYAAYGWDGVAVLASLLPLVGLVGWALSSRRSLVAA